MAEVYEKSRIALRYWLQGREWHRALEALEFAHDHHEGFRKDGTTPEVIHPISVAQYLRTLVGSLQHPEDTLVVALLHDVREDYGVSAEEIEQRFGADVAAAVDALTKTFRGADRDPDDVFTALAADPMASIVKGADRINNQHTLVGVFSPEKIERYIAETEQRILPMLRSARRRFPAQEPAYENAKLVLVSQTRMLEALIGPSGG